MPLRIVNVDAQVVHCVLCALGRVLQALEHRLEGRTRVLADQPGGCESRDRAGRFLNAETRLGGNQAGLLQGVRHVVDATLRLAGTGGQQVGDVGHLVARQVELHHGRRRGLSCLGHADLARSSQVEGARKTASEDILRGNAGFGELFNAGRRLRCRERSVRAGLDRSLSQLRHLIRGRVRGRLHGRHGRIEVRGHLPGHARKPEQARTDASDCCADCSPSRPILACRVGKTCKPRLAALASVAHLIAGALRGLARLRHRIRGPLGRRRRLLHAGFHSGCVSG